MCVYATRLIKANEEVFLDYEYEDFYKRLVPWYFQQKMDRDKNINNYNLTSETKPWLLCLQFLCWLNFN